MQQDEEKAVNIRERHREVFDSITTKYKGKILQYYGDGTLSIFNSAIEAVECGIEMQLAFQQWPQIPVRIGIHLGDIIYSEEEIIGDGVNIASRVESLAVAGSVFLSSKVNDEIKNRASIQTKSMGNFEFKNVEQPMEVFAVTNEGLIVPAQDQIKGKTKEKFEGTTTDSPGDGKRNQKKLLFSTIALIILIVTYLIYKELDTSDSIPVLDRSIAVLPFTNLSSDPENEYFSDALTGEVINNLGKVSTLKVISRTSSMVYKNSEKGLKQISKELGVEHVLEGSVHRSGDRIRITVQLIKAQSDENLWSASFDRDFDQIFDIQREIAERITEGLQIKLSNEERDAFKVEPTSDLEAYDFYLKGHEYYKGKTFADIENSIRLHRLAIEKDPTFALAYVGLVESYITAMSTHGYPRYWRDSINLYAERAYSLDPQSAEVYFALGRVNWKNERLKHYQKALEKNPNYDLAYYYVSLSHYSNKDLIGAIENLRKALELSPLDPAYQSLYAGYLYIIQQDEEAIQVATDEPKINLY